MARVLLVDAGEPSRRALHRVLDSGGHVVEATADARGAINAFESRDLDLALVSDDVDGGAPELLVRLRDRRPKIMRMLLVSPARRDVAPALVSAGLAHRSLARPFQAEALEREIGTLMETAEHIRQAVSSQPERERADRLFQECLDGRCFALARQPIVSVRDSELCAYELLLRSRHPVLSGPLEVLDAVERCDRVADLGRAVNRLAAAQVAAFPASVAVFVNTHPAQFADGQALATFEPLLPFAARVVLEITERAPLSDFHGAEQALRDLTALGFRMAVDDIGSGYNSLAVLAELQPAYIKADMSIVRRVHDDPRKQRLIHLLGSFASATGAELIAEGVETPEELDAVARHGAHLVQGYHIGKPVVEWDE
ncbi:MAG: EAL domain-containing protein [Deltaproteobacteria bacterium]|nr:EAL domain-containing protein [Deltaproteobacteria bacterium]